MSKDLVIADVVILQDPEGRYSLNTLHRASGGRETKKPSNWLDLAGTQELIAELSTQGQDSTFHVVKGGNRGGTYAHELLAVSYAGWISPAFQLRVNQAFLDMKRSQHGQVVEATPAQAALAIAKAVVAIEARQASLEASQQAQQAQLDTQAQQLAMITARQPPPGRLDPLSWLRKYSKPYLAPSLLKLFRATCKRLERPVMWRPDHFDYPLPYHTEEIMERAYEESTRQIRFFDGASPTYDPGVSYQRQSRRR